MFTRDKCKLYLKQHCDSSGDGIWRVKVIINRVDLSQVVYIYVCEVVFRRLSAL